MFAMLKEWLSRNGTPSRGDQWLATRADYVWMGGR